jgi:hypothetical protein
MITKQEIDKVLSEVNRVLLNLDKRISALEAKENEVVREYSDMPATPVKGRPKKST